MTQSVTGTTSRGLPLHDTAGPPSGPELANDLANATNDALDVVDSFRGAKAYQAAAQTLTSGATTAITLGAESFDSIGMHSTTVNPSRLTVPTGYDGIWRITAQMRFASHASGDLIAVISQNATTMAFEDKPPTGGTTTLSVSAVLAAVEGDYFEIRGLQSTGSDVDTVEGEGVTWLVAEFLGALAA